MSPRILVVDDVEALRSSMRLMLEEAGLELSVVEASDGAEALPIALSGDVDMVVSDIVMPNLDGIGLLRSIRQKCDEDELPVILVTSQTSEDTRELGFEVGASDYVTRPFPPAELVSRIRVQLRLKALQKELQRAMERFRRLSTIDDLTGLANRRYFMDTCARELSRVRRHKLAMTVCIADVDRLRGVNARVGSRAGDAVINSVAGIIQRQLRSQDTVARIGGGTFGTLLPHTDSAQAEIVAQRIREAIANHPFSGQAPGDVTVSLGTATYPSGELESVDELINAAQAGLDRAKARGGNRLDAHDTEPQSEEEA